MSRFSESGFALLVRAHGIAQAAAADLLFECGVSVLEAWLLEEIPERGDRCASEIALALDVPTSTVTRALRRLERYGYVTLTRGMLHDARVLLPRLTPLGDSIARNVRGFEHDIDRQLLSQLRPVELGALISALTRITAQAAPRTARVPLARAAPLE